MSDNLVFDSKTGVLLVGEKEGVEYYINGKRVSGEVEITKTTVVNAKPVRGRVFAKGTVSSWTFAPDEDEPDQPFETFVDSEPVTMHVNSNE